MAANVMSVMLPRIVQNIVYLAISELFVDSCVNDE